MKIGICDDESYMREQEEKICYSYFGEQSLALEIFFFESGEELLACQEEMELLILDIEMPGMDGISLKNQLQKKESSPFIIFVTNYEAKMQQAFGNKVLGFVKKGNMECQLHELFQTAIHLIGSNVMIDGEYPSRDIYAIQALKEYSKLYLKNGDVPSVRISLTKLETMLETVSFIKVHRAWLVNPRYIEKIKNHVVLVHGEEIPISIRMQKQVKEKYLEYLRKDIRY